MRIRKRQALFPSSFSPLSLSDPHLINRSPVVVQLGDATPTTPKPSPASLLAQHDAAAAQSSLDRHQPSDQAIGKSSNGYDDPSGIGESGAHRQHTKQEPLEEVVREQESGDSRDKGNNNNNHTRKGIASDSRWCEGEKAIPLKKRRGSFDNNNEKTKAAKMKTKMNKKCSTSVSDEDEEKPAEMNNNNKKKRGRGSAVMEGSRCSRVNGRGWRCCQPTLVGYSLCEHHLGKGRLRSMTSVRNRSVSKKVQEEDNQVIIIPEPEPDSEPSGKETESVISDETETKTTTKKRMKLGMVKARSISSLLGQTNTQITTTTTSVAAAHEDNHHNK